jgi:signal transduction histidine kinase
VLVAEDNADMRGYLRRLLDPHFSVALASDGGTAWELARRDPPSLVISDVMMPGLDGFGLIRELRREDRTRDVPVILLSARADPDSTLRALELGADDYIIKPFGAAELLARVGATLRNARARIDAAAARGKIQERERHEGELQALLSDLRAAQRRVAAAGDAERRRVERDLHDGAQQRLMAIRLELGLVRELLNHDPRAAGQRLDELHDELDAAVEQLRELAHGLYPPLLASDGLYTALVSVARHAAIPVTVEGDEKTRAPRPIESAAYFCCLEALQNATKHAGPGASVSIHVSISGDALQFRVSDDGAGFDPDAVRPGYGLINLRDRIDALGGNVEVTSAPGRGTTVEGRIPLL